MEIDTQIARVKDLIAKREEIDAELAGMLGIAAKARKTMRCSTCNEEGHTARTCQQKPAELMKRTGRFGGPSYVGGGRVVALKGIDG
jgi:hypothetical protein